jgi:hypothetical protein
VAKIPHKWRSGAVAQAQVRRGVGSAFVLIQSLQLTLQKVLNVHSFLKHAVMTSAFSVLAFSASTAVTFFREVGDRKLGLNRSAFRFD